MKQSYSYRNVEKKDLPAIQKWLALPHIAEWIHGDGLQSTLDGLQQCTSGTEGVNRYWIAAEGDEDFAFLIAGPVDQRESDFQSVSFTGDLAVSLDIFIGNWRYLGRGMATHLIADFLLTQFPEASDFVIDPEKSNARAVHVYEKVGFKIAGEFIASWHPVPHLMMHVTRETLSSIVLKPKGQREQLGVANNTQLVKEILEVNYNIEAADIVRLSDGADVNACIHKVQANDQRQYFVKSRLETSDNIGSLILGLLKDSGVQQAIFPIPTSTGEIICSRSGISHIVFPFVEGSNGFSRSLNESEWCLLGKTLSHIHGIDVPSEMQNSMQKESFSSDTRNSAAALLAQIDTIKASDEAGRKFLKLVNTHKKHFEQIKNHTESLCRLIKSKPQTFVLCHSDIHAGNVLLSEDGLLYIVDWDEPIMAPKERNLMFIGGGVGNVWNRQSEEAFFYKGYGNAEVDKTLLAYYRFERILVDLIEYAKELLLNTASIRERDEMYQQFSDQFKSDGVIDRAFE